MQDLNLENCIAVGYKFAYVEPIYTHLVTFWISAYCYILLVATIGLLYKVVLGQIFTIYSNEKLCNEKQLLEVGSAVYPNMIISYETIAINQTKKSFNFFLFTK